MLLLDNLETARHLFVEGTDEYNAGRYLESELKFRDALNLAPDRISILISLSAALLKQKKFTEAKAVCHKAIAINPDASEPLFNLGLVLRLERHFDEALKYLDASARLAPDFSDTWHYRGSSLNALGRHLDALKSYDKALTLQPQRADSLIGAAEVLFDMGLTELSLVFVDRVLQADTQSAEAHYQKALAHQRRENAAGAVESFKAALAGNHPNADFIKFSLAALQGVPYEGETPAAYVSSLFDRYASTFEQHLKESLEYSTPRLLFDKMSGHLNGGRDIADIGCGTGLMGEQLKSKAKRLVGIDLSQKMTDLAAKKQIYDALHVSDFNVFLEGQRGKFDVVVAADVLNYVGDLNRTFTAVHQALRDEGLFAFTVEAAVDDGFRLQNSLRYSHAPGYCAETARRHGFSVMLCEKDFLRKEKSSNVFGYYFVLAKR
jgi:predicted TPR repeat methyltransferase